MATEVHTAETKIFIRAFKSAWEKAVSDYESRRINGEHTLQASLYRHMSDCLEREKGVYRVFTEAAVQRNDIRKDDLVEAKSVRSVVDILVVYQSNINEQSVVVGAVEIKFNSRGLAKANDIRKDLTTLSSIANRNDPDLRSELKMHRMLTDEKKPEIFRILPQKKLIFAAFCKASHSAIESRMDEKNFWSEHKPEAGRWQGKPQPWHLGVALAKVKPLPAGQHECKGLTEKQFFGKAFDFE